MKDRHPNQPTPPIVNPSPAPASIPVHVDTEEEASRHARSLPPQEGVQIAPDAIPVPVPAATSATPVPPGVPDHSPNDPNRFGKGGIGGGPNQPNQ